ncbi:hypothetical protein [Actinomadura sp. 3N508]|uniref:hypothetical protein n=1 Tax=Actinomadura sp. 3N508 TaxID=3375153 RepID=UPI0037AF1C50
MVPLPMVRMGSRSSLAAAAFGTMAACSGNGGESLDLSGVKAYDLLTKEQLTAFGLDM